MITKEMTIEEIIRRYPRASDVFLKYGLDCIGCQIAEFESVEHAARVYNLNLEALLRDLNQLV